MESKVPIIFVGVADHVESPRAVAPPVGALDIFKLSVVRQMIFYPANIKNLQWLFLVDADLLRSGGTLPKLRVVGEDGYEVGWSTITIRRTSEGQQPKVESEDIGPEGVLLPHHLGWMLMHFNLDAVVPCPGPYRLTMQKEDEEITLGIVEFTYEKNPPLTEEQIKAIESDPFSLSAVRIELKCTECSDEMKTYAALDRLPKLEAKGFVRQHEIPDRFKCQCGKTDWPVHFLRESLHGFLGKESMHEAGVSYGRRYGHAEIVKTVSAFMKLVEEQDDEGPIQKFVEANPVMLAQFQAAKLMPEQGILGKYRADFVVLDTKKRLWLIELERPALPLFKNGGHMKAQLVHAYEQVTDWLREYQKHPVAVLEGMGLKSEEVNEVRGMVIAGRTRDVDQGHLRRHLSSSSFPDVEFMTLDDLARGVLQISRRLA